MLVQMRELLKLLELLELRERVACQRCREEMPW
jgi:hypothetical protein